MNKIYKVIWSRVKNCYVVTHEFAKTHGKTATKAVTAAVLASVIGGMTPAVFAEDVVLKENILGVEYEQDSNSIVLGKSTKETVLEKRSKLTFYNPTDNSELVVYLSEEGKPLFVPPSDPIAPAGREFLGWLATSGKVLTRDMVLNTAFDSNVTLTAEYSDSPVIEPVDPGDPSITGTNEDHTKAAVGENEGPNYSPVKPMGNPSPEPSDPGSSNPGTNPSGSNTPNSFSAYAGEAGVDQTPDSDTPEDFRTITTIKKSNTPVKIQNLANGAVSEDSKEAVNGSQLYEAMRGLPSNPVEYTDVTKEKIHLEGEAGTVIDRVKAGQLSKGSMEAVNGSQLYAVEQRFQTFQGLLTDVNTTVGNLSTSISDEMTTNITQQEDIDVLKTQVANGFNVTIDGAKVKKINPQSNYINFAAGSGISLKATDAEGVEISVDTSGGKVEKNNSGVLNGGTVYTELRPVDGNYVKEAYTTSANLTALDTQTKANTDAIAGLGDSKAGVGLENITTAGENKIKEVMREGMDGKANIDGSNITKSAWNTVLGTGAVATDNTELVTGKTVYNEVRPADGNFVKTANTTAANLTALDTKVQEALTGVSGLGDNKANVGLDNLSDAGKTVIQQAAQSAVKVVDGENTTVTSEKDAAGNVSYKVKANADGTVTEGNTGLVSGGSVYNAITEGNKNAVQYDGDDHNTITLSGTGEDGTKITHLADGSLDKDSTDAVNGGQFYDYMQAVNQLLEGKSDANANNVGANAAVDNSEAWGSALGTGTVEKNNGKLVTGGTMFDELRPTDGEFVKQSNTTAANLLALDNEVALKANQSFDNINEDGKTVIKDLAKGAVKVVDGDNTTVSFVTDPDGSVSYKVKANATGQVAANNTGLVDGGTVFTAIQNVSNNLSALGGNVVLYDGVDKSKVTFGGTGATSRVQLTNVKDAVLSETSTDAVTGQQLYKTNQDIIGFATDIATNKNNIEGMNQSVTAAQASAAATSRLVTTLNTAKADKSLSNLSDAGKLVLQSYATNAVQEYMKANASKSASSETASNSRSSSRASAMRMAKAPAGPVRMPASGTGPNTNYVVYNDAMSDTLTLEGSAGTLVDRVKAGQLSQGSMQAVNGSQLYALHQKFQTLQGNIATNNTTIGQAQADIANIKTDNILLQSDVDVLKTQMETGFNVTINGAKVKTVNPESNYINFVKGDHIKLENDGKNGVKVSAVADGTITSGSKGLVTGDTVYNAIKGLGTEAALAGKANTGLDNLSEAGKTTVKDLAKEAVKVKAGSNITVSTDADGYTVGVKANGAVAAGDTGLLNGGALHTELRPTDGKYVKKSNTTAGNLTALDSQVQTNTNKIDAMEQAIGDVSGKANADASNVAEHSAKWGAAIGTGEVAEGNGELVTGGTVFGAIDGAKTELQSEINKKADADLKNLSDQGKGVVRNLAKGAVKVEGKGAAIVTSAEKGDATVYTVDVKKDGKVEAGNDGIVTGGTVHDALQAATAGVNTALNGKADVGLTNLSEEGKQTIRDAVKDDLAGKADTGLSNLTEGGKNVIRDTMKNDLDKKADKDAGNIEVSKWASKLGNGEVKAGDKGLVNGDTVFEALKDVNGTDLIGEKDGAIRIGAKDKYDGLNTVDLSKSDGKGRVLTGVVTDPQRGDSAANVGYVNGVAGILQDNMNRGFQTMDSRINKAGARSAALAGLHPVDADSDQKWNVAIGYGNFKGENAAAAGIFYKPDDRFMVNVSSTLQDQENMVSAGMSFALDKGSGLSSRRALNNKVNKLEDALKQVIAANNAMVQELNALKGQQMALNGMTKEFPDVPQNHWAHKAVTNLHGSDIVQGYPDGEFKGNRSMTRYEYAEMLYNAITAGKKVPAEMQREYAKELAEVKKARG